MRVHDLTQLKQWLLDVWANFEQTTVDKAEKQLGASFNAKGINLWQVVTCDAASLF